MSDRHRISNPVPRQSEGSAAFLDGLSRRYRNALNRFFERRAPDLRSEADDLTQEVFERLARRDGDEIENPESYLFRAAANVLTDRVRRRTSRHADDHIAYDEDQHCVEDFSPERVLIGREEVERVIGAIETLPDRTRIVFALHRFEELKYAEIASRLGISVSAVEKHIIKALRHIADATGGQP